jgi:hypothetical protein
MIHKRIQKILWKRMHKAFTVQYLFFRQFLVHSLVAGYVEYIFSGQKKREEIGGMRM